MEAKTKLSKEKALFLSVTYTHFIQPFFIFFIFF